jgi:hypothetical protein
VTPEKLGIDTGTCSAAIDTKINNMSILRLFYHHKFQTANNLAYSTSNSENPKQKEVTDTPAKSTHHYNPV